MSAEVPRNGTVQIRRLRLETYRRSTSIPARTISRSPPRRRPLLDGLYAPEEGILHSARCRAGAGAVEVVGCSPDDHAHCDGELEEEGVEDDERQEEGDDGCEGAMKACASSRMHVSGKALLVCRIDLRWVGAPTHKAGPSPSP